MQDKLCFPEFDFKLKKQNDTVFIFDIIRKKWIVCTKEEWVRQNLIQYLITYCQVPQNLIVIEKPIKIANKIYRFDLLIYNKITNNNILKPLIIAECKAPNINLSQEVYDQVLHYNYLIEAPYFIITNGISLIMGKQTKENNVEFLTSMPKYNEIIEL